MGQSIGLEYGSITSPSSIIIDDGDRSSLSLASILVILFKNITLHPRVTLQSCDPRAVISNE